MPMRLVHTVRAPLQVEGTKCLAPPTEMAGIWEGEGNENYRTVEAQVSISVDYHAIHHLMLNDKIILTKT